MVDINVDNIINCLDNNSSDKIKSLALINLEKSWKYLVLSSELSNNSKIFNSLCNSVTKLKSNEHKLLALKSLWRLSLNIDCNGLFVNDKSWLSLHKICFQSIDLNIGLYYISIVCFIQMSNVRNIIDNEILQICINYLNKMKFDKVLIRYLISTNEVTLLSNGVLYCLAESASRGFTLPGLLLVCLFEICLLPINQKENIIENIFKESGLSSIQKVLLGYLSPSEVKLRLKSLLIQLLQQSLVTCEKFVDAYVDLASSIDCLGYPQGLCDPRTIHLCFIDDPDLDNDIDILDNDDDKCFNVNERGEEIEQPILRDIEWKPRNGKSWRMCSAVLWSRCPGLRAILDEFWDSGGGGLELRIDASGETLDCICNYINNTTFIPPKYFYHQLELIKVSNELEMLTLHNLSIQYIKYLITINNFEVIYDFSKTFHIISLENICNDYTTNQYQFSVTKLFDKQLINDVKVNTNTIYDNDLLLNDEINQSINEVTNLIDQSNIKIKSNHLDNLNPLNDNSIAEYVDEFIDYSNNHKKDNHKTTKVKSGGIYGLLLRNSNTSNETNNAIDITNNHNKTTNKKPSNDTNNKLTKKSTNSNSANSINNKPIKSAEYNPNMTLEPKKSTAASEREKRINSLSQPKNVINKYNQKNSTSNNTSIISIDTVEDKLDNSMIIESNDSVTIKNKPSKTDYGNTNKKSNNIILNEESVRTGDDDIHSIVKTLDTNNKPVNSSVRNSLMLLKTKTRRNKAIDNEVITTNTSIENIENFTTSNTAKVSNHYDSVTNDEVINSDLNQCPDCKRSFNQESFSKHIKICKKVFKTTRKAFDSSSKRLDVENYPELIDLNKLKSKSNNSTSNNNVNHSDTSKSQKWKYDSEFFRNSIKAARNSKSTVQSIPDPSYVQCPHCSRRFNAIAADRHIPVCKNTKAKPTLLKKGSGRGQISNLR